MPASFGRSERLSQYGNTHLEDNMKRIVTYPVYVRFKWLGDIHILAKSADDVPKSEVMDFELVDSIEVDPNGQWFRFVYGENEKLISGVPFEAKYKNFEYGG